MHFTEYLAKTHDTEKKKTKEYQLIISPSPSTK